MFLPAAIIGSGSGGAAAPSAPGLAPGPSLAPIWVSHRAAIGRGVTPGRTQGGETGPSPACCNLRSAFLSC